jgi:alpha-tubulin suppressor-like RCC1 family protein
LALSDDGKVYGWGNNSHGQLGLNQKVYGVFFQQPTVVQELTPDKCILQVMNLKSTFEGFFS